MKAVTNVQREITERMFEAMYHLIAIGKIKNKTEFSEAIKFTYPHLIRLEKSTAYSISLDAIYYAWKNLGVNSEFIITGNGNILSKLQKIDLNQKLNQNSQNSVKNDMKAKSQKTDKQKVN